MNDLVKRLRELYRFSAEQKSRDWDEQDEIRHLFNLIFHVGYEAADRIEALEKEVSTARKTSNYWKMQLVEGNKRIEALETALRGIRDGPRDADKSYPDLFAEVRIEARAALAGEKKDE